MPVISHLEAIRSRRAGGQQVIATWRAWLAAMPGRKAAATWAGVQGAEQVERNDENLFGKPRRQAQGDSTDAGQAS